MSFDPELYAIRNNNIVIVAHYPEGLNVAVPMSIGFLDEDPSVVGPALIKLIKDAIAEERNAKA